MNPHLPTLGQLKNPDGTAEHCLRFRAFRFALDQLHLADQLKAELDDAVDAVLAHELALIANVFHDCARKKTVPPEYEKGFIAAAGVIAARVKAKAWRAE